MTKFLKSRTGWQWSAFGVFMLLSGLCALHEWQVRGPATALLLIIVYGVCFSIGMWLALRSPDATNRKDGDANDSA